MRREEEDEEELPPLPPPLLPLGATTRTLASEPALAADGDDEGGGSAASQGPPYSRASSPADAHVPTPEGENAAPATGVAAAEELSLPPPIPLPPSRPWSEQNGGGENDDERGPRLPPRIARTSHSLTPPSAAAVTSSRPEARKNIAVMEEAGEAEAESASAAAAAAEAAATEAGEREERE